MSTLGFVSTSCFVSTLGFVSTLSSLSSLGSVSILSFLTGLVLRSRLGCIASGDGGLVSSSTVALPVPFSQQIVQL